jgi:hypothetical protein
MDDKDVYCWNSNKAQGDHRKIPTQLWHLQNIFVWVAALFLPQPPKPDPLGALSQSLTTSCRSLAAASAEACEHVYLDIGSSH